MGPEDRTSPAPDDMVAWLRNHPLLETSEPVPVTVGGQEGVLLDVSVAPGLEDYPTESCGPDDPCVFLMTTSAESGFALWADQTNRLMVLEDVEGETVILAASGPKDGFANFAPKVERLLATVQFGDARAWFGAPETDLPADLGSGIGAATSDPVRTLPTEGSMEAGVYRTDEFEPASIGGATGVRFDLAATSAPKEATDLCGIPCVPGYPVGPTAVDFFLGTEEQDLVLEVGDEIVLVSVTAPTGELEGFLPKVQEVLDTVEWQGAFLAWEIPLRLTQTDLAGLVGASRVRVNRALGYFRKRGNITVGRDHRIVVHDGEALARRAR